MTQRHDTFMEYEPGAVPASIDWYTDRGEAPTIVSISDIHGYLESARAALTAIDETESYPPVVTTDESGQLHWAGNDYILLINGDLIDRGPHNDECLELMCRLAAESAPGRVRYHLGNHEMAILFPERFPWPGLYSIELDRQNRRQFLEHVKDGRIPVAFEGYRYTYSHAGQNEAFDVATVNKQAQSAAEQLLAAMDAGRYETAQQSVIDRHEHVFGIGESSGGRGPAAGLLWMDFQFMELKAPPQIVGHSRHSQPTRLGRVVCQNVIRSNRHSPGGEAVLLEEDGSIKAVINDPNGATVRAL